MFRTVDDVLTSCHIFINQDKSKIDRTIRETVIIA